MKINNFRGDLTDISANKAPLAIMDGGLSCEIGASKHGSICIRGTLITYITITSDSVWNNDISRSFVSCLFCLYSLVKKLFPAKKKFGARNCRRRQKKVPLAGDKPPVLKPVYTIMTFGEIAWETFASNAAS